ncbi:MAG: hypothetical protein WBS17_01575 [Candidatus Acidiferrales bacterium]
MRIFVAVALILCGLVVTPLLLDAQVSRAQPRSSPAAPCGDQSRGLPDSYYDAVISLVKPPEAQHHLIQIMAGGEIKLVLWTDGQKFKLWTNKLVTPQKNIGQFLLDLDQECRLPPDPQDAFALLKLTWESKDLSAAQFALLHRGFTEALSKYAANMQGRYAEMIATRISVVSFEAAAYSIIYDNSYEHVQIHATNSNDDLDPIVDWARRLQQIGEDSFQRPIWRHAAE